MTRQRQRFNPKNYVRTVFFGLHGDDNASGLNEDKLKRNFYAAVAEAVLIPLGAGERGCIVSLGTGTFDHIDTAGLGSLTLPDKWDVFMEHSFLNIAVGTDTAANAKLITNRNTLFINGISMADGGSWIVDGANAAVTGVITNLVANTPTSGLLHIESTATNSEVNIEFDNITAVDKVILNEADTGEFNIEVNTLRTLGALTITNPLIDIDGANGTLRIWKGATGGSTGTITGVRVKGDAEVCVLSNVLTGFDVDYETQDTAVLNVITCVDNGNSITGGGTTLNILSASDDSLNLYSSDGTLASNRVVSLDGNTLTLREGVGSGLAPDGIADDLTIDTDGLNAGLSILAAAGGNSNIFFGEFGNSNAAAKIQHIGSVNELRMNVAGGGLLRFITSVLRYEGDAEIRGQADVPQWKLYSHTVSQGNPLMQLYDTAGVNSWNWYNSVLRAAGRDTAFQSVAGFKTVIKRSTGADGTRFYDNGDITNFYNVGIGADVNAVTILDVVSTTKGVRFPRMTAAQASAIVAIDGLMLYATSTDATFTSIGYWVYESGTWTKVTGGAAASLAATLLVGNTSGGTAIRMSTTDKIEFGGAGEFIQLGVGGTLDYESDKAHVFTVNPGLGDDSVFSMQGSDLRLEKLGGSGSFYVIDFVDGTILFSNSAGDSVTLDFNEGITASRVLDLPDGDGTLIGHNTASKVVGDSPISAVANDVLLCDATGGNITVNLPAAASSTNFQVIVKKTDASANTITVDGNLAETIDGALTQVISVQYVSLTLVCDGSNWFII